MKKKLHPLLELFFCVTIGIAIIFTMYLFADRPFTINNDQVFEYNVLFKEWIHLIEGFFQGKGLPLYSWNTFLGNDFYAAMAFYTTGDIFMPLYFLVKDVQLFLFIETIICLYISAFAMYFFLQKVGIKKQWILLYLSLIYCFGGWGTLFIGQYMFHRFFAFIPFLFYGVEYYHQHRKGWPFILSVAILFYHCFYFMWPLSLFLLFYCIEREIEWKHSTKEFLHDTVHLLGYYVVGFLIASFLAIPALLYIASNPRIGHVREFAFFWPIKVMIGYVISFVTAPFPVRSVYPNIFQINDSGYGYLYSQFVTVIPFLSAFGFVKKHRSWGILLIGLMIGVLFLPFSSLMHAFSDPSMRWNFVIELLILYLAGRYLEDNESLNVKKLGYGYLGLCIVLVLLLPILKLPVSVFWIHYGSICVCLILGLICIQLPLKKGLLVGVVEIILYASLMVHTWYIEIPDFEWRINESMMKYLQDTDEDRLYRYHIYMKDIVPAGLNLNISLQYQFLSAKTYESTSDTNILPFLDFIKTEEIRLDINDPYALTALGTKYWLVTDEKDLPSELPFSYFTNLSDLNAYKNEAYHGFGYCLSKLDSFNHLNNSKQLLDTLFIDVDSFDYSHYQGGESQALNILAKATNYLLGEITLTKPNILYIAIPNNKGWTIRVDNQQIEPISVNGGFIGIPLEEGYHQIEMNYMTPGLKAGVLGSLIGIVLFIGIVWVERKNDKKG
ncbi:MAG: YfhO family protein [Solobacterium sp.]|nr:YfhO family protein [Solobacterium sp.]